MTQPIPLVLVLWEHPNFGGIKRTIIKDVVDLGQLEFNDKASSIGVHAGPGYAAAPGGMLPTVSVFPHPNHRGPEAILGVGTYPRIETFGHNDSISSVLFNSFPQPSVAPGDPPAAIDDIPLIVTLHTNVGRGQLTLTLVEPSRQLQSEFGSTFNDSIESVYVEPGPTFAGQRLRLHRDPDFRGGSLELRVDNGPAEAWLPSENLSRLISSVQFVDAQGRNWPG